MKRIITLFCMAAATAATAQTKVVTQAVITTKTTTVSPEGSEDMAPPPPPSGDGGEQRVTFRFGGDGETKTVTTLKGDMVKTYTENEMSRITTLRDNAKKTTTTLMEMMGKKTGVVATDEDQAAAAKKLDSMMQSRSQNGGGNFNFSSNTVTASDIAYTEESKKIAGLQCKKALVINTRKNGNKDTTVVWYCPDFKLQGLVSTGGTSGFGGFGARLTGLSGLDNLAGFPMQYEMKLNRGRKMIVEVTKITLDKEVSDKEFEISKDFELKSMKDMQNGGGPGMMFRFGGPGGGGGQ
ncbi:hypothetical protein [Ferruginibacter sp.]